MCEGALLSAGFVGQYLEYALSVASVPFVAFGHWVVHLQTVASN